MGFIHTAQKKRPSEPTFFLTNGLHQACTPCIPTLSTYTVALVRTAHSPAGVSGRHRA